MNSHIRFRSLLIILGLFSYIFSFAQVESNVIKIPFLSQNGDTLKLANEGGLNNPQFLQMDINRDGDSDYLVFDKSCDQFFPFINKNGNYYIDWELQSNFPNIKNWALTYDYNNDSIPDILGFSTQPGVSGMSVHKGIIKNDTLKYIEDIKFLTFLRQSNNTTPNIFITNIDYPAVNDYDHDGDMDILTFNINGGKIDLYKNISQEKNASLDSLEFIRDNTCFGGIFESGISTVVDLSPIAGSCATNLTKDNPIAVSRHAGSTLLWEDLDNDNDLDLLIGDVSFNQLNKLSNQEEDGTTWYNQQDPNWPNESTPVNLNTFPSAFAVRENNQLKEILVSPNQVDLGEDVNVVWRYLKSESSQDFSLQSTSFLTEDMVDVGTASHPVFMDYDHDGDHDIVVGNNKKWNPTTQTSSSSLFVFQNIGSDAAPVYQMKENDWLNLESNTLAWSLSPTVGDLDQDGDLDLVIGTGLGSLLYYENKNGVYEINSSLLAEINVGNDATPLIFDINQDGWNDLVIGEKNGNLNYFESNDGIFSSTPQNEIWKGVDVRDGSLFGSSQPLIIPTKNGDRLLVGSQSGKIYDYGLLTNDDISAIENKNITTYNFGKFSRISALKTGDNTTLMVGNFRGGISFIDLTAIDPPLVANNDKIKIPFVVYPQPSSGLIKIKSEEKPQKVHLFDALGRLIQEIKNYQGEDINISNQGIYYLIATFNDSQQIEKIIIK